MKRLRNNPGGSYPDDEENEIDIIPLVDVMLLLLTFFIFVTLAMVMQEGISVSLAQAESGKTVKQQEPIVVSIKESGNLFLNKKEMTETNLLEALSKKARKKSNRPVFINADEKAQHENVILALDKVQKAGLSNVTFTVKPQQ